MERILSRTLRPDVLAKVDWGEDQLIGSPINLGASNSTLEVTWQVVETSVTTTDNSPPQDYTERFNYTITCYPLVQIIYCSTLEVKKKIFKPTIHNKANTTLAYVLGLFLKINTTVRILSSILRHSFQASGQHLVTCVHTDSSKPFETLESTFLDITVRTCLAVQYRFSRFFVICHVRTIWTFLTAVCNITKCVGVETTWKRNVSKCQLWLWVVSSTFWLYVKIKI